MDIKAYINNNNKVLFKSFANDIKGVKNCHWNFDDGKMGRSYYTSHVYEKYETYIVIYNA